MSRKARKLIAFFRLKLGGLQKKKKKKRSSSKFRVIFRPKIQRFFAPKIRWSPKKKKKKVFAKIQSDISSNSQIQTFEGGLFSIFHIKSASKAQKKCDFAYFTSQWGARAPPPPLATLLTVSQTWVWGRTLLTIERFFVLFLEKKLF